MARKPLSGTVAGNVLEHGVGALNVDGCRVGTDGGGNVCPGGELCKCDTDGRAYSPTKHPVRREGDFGRWPANVVLSHTEGCVQVGTRKVKGSSHPQEPTDTGDVSAFGGGVKDGTAYGDAAGTETVGAWSCTPDCPVRLLDEQTGELQSGSREAGEYGRLGYQGWDAGPMPAIDGDRGGASRFFPTFDNDHEETECAGSGGSSTISQGDTSSSPSDGGTALSGAPPAGPFTARPEPIGAERFRYVAKASRGERNAGLEGFEETWAPTMGNGIGGKPHDEDIAEPKRNVHPTVKPISLMRWLVRLVTPPGGTVLDPFCGSGTTGCAAVLEGFDFVGLEREQEYVDIARARIAWWHKHRGDGEAAQILAAGELRDEVEATGQLGMFD